MFNTNTLNKNKELKLKTFICAFISALLMFLPFVVYQNGYFTCYGDFTSQTVVFNSQCNELIKNGQLSWCWWNNAGTDFVEAFSYYTLGSPFFYLTLLFPAKMVPYLLVPVMCLKIALSALFAYIYLRQYTKTSYAAMAGSLLYALSGWTIYNLFFYTFLDALIFLPLILYSLDRFITNKDRGLLCLSIALCALDNYYFIFQIGLFAMVYFLVKLLRKDYIISFKEFLNLAFEVILGILISSILLLPSIINILSMPRINGSEYSDKNDIFKNISSLFIQTNYEKYIEILNGFFFPSISTGLNPVFRESTLRWGSVSYGLPMISIIGVISFMKEKTKHWLKPMLIISLLCMFIPVLNSAFNLFSAHYMRWTFIPVLFMALATAIALEDKQYSFKMPTVFIGVFLSILCIIPFFLPNKTKKGWVFGCFDVVGSTWYKRQWILMCVISVVSLLVFVLFISIRRTNFKKFFKTFIACSCVTFIISGIISISFGVSTITDYKNYPVKSFIESEVNIDDTSENYRVATDIQFYNYTQLHGYQSAENFQTFVSNSTTEFYQYLGYKIGGPYSYYDNNKVRTFLSTKYFITDKEGYSDYKKTKDSYKKSPLNKDGTLKSFGYKILDKKDGVNLYKNNYYIPYGFTYDKYYFKEDVNNLNIDEKSTLLLNGMLLNKVQEKKYSHMFNGKLDVKKAISNDSDKSYARDCENITSNGVAQNFKITNNGFNCNFSSDKDNLLFFSIPYHDGWSAYVNNKKIEIEQVNIGFMAIPVTEGQNDIVFVYENNFVEIGRYISIVCILVFIVYLFFINREKFIIKRRHC